MKLLLDENLSFRLLARLTPDLPGSEHVDLAGLHTRADAEIWAFPRDHGFTILSKENDFRQLSVLHGARQSDPVVSRQCHHGDYCAPA